VFGLFSGTRDSLYEDEETRVGAGKFGYVLETGLDTRFPDSHGPLKEAEMFKLLKRLDVPRRSRIEKAIKEHSDMYPKFRG